MSIHDDATELCDNCLKMRMECECADDERRASAVTRQLRYQRNRRGQGQVRRWFWLDADTLALYDRLLRAYGYGGKEKMMADALAALDAQQVPK
ncbi:MAG TPA: hypothetical protein VN689_00520 [Burkholderiales bacterium]|nr:hypothetical protein [Burkholderiales bacterium]